MAEVRRKEKRFFSFQHSIIGYRDKEQNMTILKNWSISMPNIIEIGGAV